MTTRKGMVGVGVLIGTLVFLLLLFVAIIPTLAPSINAISTSNKALPNGDAVNSLLIMTPMMVVLGAISIIAFSLLTG